MGTEQRAHPLNSRTCKYNQNDQISFSRHKPMCNQETIEIIINEDGTMTSSATGISGEVTEEELNRILGELADVNNVVLRTEFHEPAAGITSGTATKSTVNTSRGG